MIFRIAFSNFLRLCRTKVSFFILSFICLVCAFVSLLFLQERGYYIYTDSIKGQTAQVLYFSSEDANTIKNTYTNLVKDLLLPRMEIVTISNEKYAGIDWDRDLNDEVWYTPYGRFFSTEEMVHGEAVALLGTGFISQLPQESIDTIWETGIDINGKQFHAIGNYFFEWVNEAVPVDVYKDEPMSASIVIPLKTFFDVGLSASRFRCEFSSPLTSTQITHLCDLLEPYSDIYSLTLPTSNVDAANSYVNEVAPTTLIIILSLLSIASVILYWLRIEFARYRVYLICGAKRRHIAYFLSLNITFLVTMTYICAYFASSGLTRLTPEEIISPLPWQLNIVIYIVLLFCTLLVVHIKAIPIVYREKILHK